MIRSGNNDFGAGRAGLRLAVVLFFLCSGAVAARGAALLLEPGFPTGDGTWLVPVSLVDDQGAHREIAPGELRVTLEGRTLDGCDLGYFSPEPGGSPSVVAVLVDGDFPGTGLGPLRDFLAAGTPRSRRGLFLCGPQLTVLQEMGRKPPAEAELYDKLAPDEPVPLWDNILAAIGILGEEGPVRKVLVVISGSGESRPSEHPSSTCVEAALRARVAVQVVELTGDSATLGRLRELARRTGGLASPFMGKGSLRRSLARVDEVQALSIPAAGQSLPAELVVALTGDLEVSGTVRVAEQKALAGPGPILLAGLFLGILAVAAGAVALYRVIARKAGFLVMDFQGKRREVAIPRSGLTIGSEKDNQLVLDDERISRHHAVIRVKGEEVILTDLRSVSGTWVNERTVRNASLRDGDRVLLGGAVELVFRQRQGKHRA